MKQPEPIQRPSIDGLRSKMAVLQKRLHTLAIESMIDPAKLDERAKVAQELDVIPTWIGQLKRQEALEHIAAMAKVAAGLAVEVAEAEKAVAEYNAAHAALDAERRKTPGSTGKLEVTAKMHVLTDKGMADGLVSALQTKRAKLDALYSLATRTYQVFLDQSPRQMSHRLGIHPSLSYEGASTEQAWEAAALRAGQAAEQEARRELAQNGNGSGLRMRL